MLIYTGERLAEHVNAFCETINRLPIHHLQNIPANSTTFSRITEDGWLTEKLCLSNANASYRVTMT